MRNKLLDQNQFVQSPEPLYLNIIKVSMLDFLVFGVELELIGLMNDCLNQSTTKPRSELYSIIRFYHAFALIR